MGAELPVFTQEELAINEAQGFPKAYALLCRTSATNDPFAHGPPHCFIPYALTSQEVLRVKELDQMFPIIHPEICCSSNLRTYANFLWEQLDHLGNAGFKPAMFRVDCFGNVVYWHADSASPLAWDIDHWFPISRGGKTVPGNLRILQWQVCKKKKNKLDFLIPWWDLQLGISVNQFLSIFASRNSDFRSRAFSFLFSDGRSDEHDYLQNSNLHSFPHKFMDAKRKQGLAPAAIVLSHNSNSSETMALKAVDLNRSLKRHSLFTAPIKSSQKEDVTSQELQELNSSIPKGNSQPAVDDHENNPYLTISCARDLLRQRKDARKQQAEIRQLDEELNELKNQNDTERIALQELEAVIIRRRRRVEKCRRLSEAQASYRSLLEKMIRDAMHQTVVYKEQLRLNQAATSALIARLEAQRAACDSAENEVRRKYKQRDELELQAMACDSAENEVRRKYKQRDELELQAMACYEQAPETSRIYDDFNENGGRLSSVRRARKPTKKELRVFLEEEQKAFEAGFSLSFDKQEESEGDELEEATCMVHDEENHCQSSKVNQIKDDTPLNSKLKGFTTGDESYRRINNQKKQLSCTYSSLYNVEEGNGTILLSNGQDMIVKNMLKQNQHRELSTIKPNVSCGMIKHQNMQASHPCVSSCNVDGYDAALVSNRLKLVQKRKLDAIMTDEPQKHWNFHLCSREQEKENEEYMNRVGKENVEKWLQILLENAKEGSDSHPTPRNSDEITDNTNAEIKQNEVELC